MAGKITLESLEEMDYSRKEALNSLRTNLQFSGVDKKVILFTSCTPNEGKSTVTMELARSLSESDKKVLLIDADLRKSVLVGRYHMQGKGEIKGLSHFLSGQNKLDDVIYHTDLNGLDIIVAGPVAPNPTELLGKELFKETLQELREQYDMILVDCPPLGWIIDAAVVAPFCDAAILVVESDAISYRYLQDVKKQLEITGIPILGVVLNKVKIGSGYSQYGKYGKYGGKYGKYGKYGEYGEYSNSSSEK